MLVIRLPRSKWEVSAIGSQSRVGYPGIQKDEEGLRFDTWTQARLAKRVQKAKEWSTPGMKTFCVLFENLERVRRGRGSSGCGKKARCGRGLRRN